MLGTQGSKITQADWERVANFIHPHSVTDTIEVAGGAYSGTFVHRGVEGEITTPIATSSSGNFLRRGESGLEAGVGQPVPSDLYVYDGTTPRSVKGYGEVTVRGTRGNENYPTLVTEPGQPSHFYAEYRGGKQVKNTVFIPRVYNTDPNIILSDFSIHTAATPISGAGTLNLNSLFTVTGLDYAHQVSISAGGSLRVTTIGLKGKIVANENMVAGVALRGWPGDLKTVTGDGATFTPDDFLNNASPLTLKLSPKTWEKDGYTYRIAHFYRVNGTTLTPLITTSEQNVTLNMQIVTRQ